jgi:putative spermidine/putrescine transport system substrate-binding protein
MSARYNKLLAQKESPEADIFISTSEALISAINEGLVVKINRDNLSNMDALYDWAMPKPEYGAAYSAIAYGLGYNPDFFGDDPPDSWEDLWRPEVQGKIAVPAIGHSMMIDFIITAAEINGGSADSPDAGFDALAELDPVAQTYFYTDWNALFDAGDVVLATDFDYYVNTMADNGSNIVYVIPTEKAFGSLQHASVVAGTENQEAAEAFINVLLSAEVQDAVGTKLLNAPARSDIELSAELAERLACYGDSLNDIRWFDPTFNSDNRPAWSEMMNEKVAPSWGD